MWSATCGSVSRPASPGPPTTCTTTQVIPGIPQCCSRSALCPPDTLMNDLFGVQICKRSIENALKKQQQSDASLSSDYDLNQAGVKWVGSDETGCRVEGRRWWQWTWQSDLGGYYAIDQRRGYNVVKTHFGRIIKAPLCHDCWSAHNNTVAASRPSKAITPTYNESHVFGKDI